MAEKIDLQLLRKVASNARISLNEEDEKKFLPQLKDVLESFSIIDKIDTDEEPSFQPIPMKNVFREDKVGECLSQEDALSNTKHKKDGYFKGPRVV